MIVSMFSGEGRLPLKLLPLWECKAPEMRNIIVDCLYCYFIVIFCCLLLLYFLLCGIFSNLQSLLFVDCHTILSSITALLNILLPLYTLPLFEWMSDWHWLIGRINIMIEYMIAREGYILPKLKRKSGRKYWHIHIC